jgi:DNA-binding LytR/AlgR family response regulator
MEDKLPPEQFQRIHRSFIVNVNHVDEVAQNHITVENKILPLSKELRKDLLDRLRLV